MTNFTKSMFESIKETLENQKSGGGFKNILKTEVGNSYIVRLIPNIKNPGDTFYHYYHHGWNSVATTQYVNAICPTTWGDRCPICEERLKLYRIGTDEAKDKASLLKRKESWLVNVYVVKDPKVATNNNQIRILRYGKQIDKIIQDAISGEDASAFGASIFDLSENGCNFRVKVEKNEGDYPTYVSSKFLPKEPIEGMTPQKAEQICSNIYVLDKLFETQDYEELKELLADHYEVKAPKAEAPKAEAPKAEAPKAKVEEPKTEAPKVETPKAEAPKTINEVNEIDEADEKLKDLLAGL